MRVWLLVVAACGGSSDKPIDAAMIDVAPDSQALVQYRETCDGSGAAAIDAMHFVDVNDENQALRLYQRGVATPLQTMELGLGEAVTAEVDLEDLERVGNRLYMVASHGRKASGNLDRARYKYAAFDLGGTPPAITLTPVGVSGQLLDQMLVSANWDTPNANVIAALQAASMLGTASDPNLAPEVNGTNIEALASDGAGKLLVGFRNPRPAGKAIVVAIANPDAALTGAARFANAFELDLGGLGIRSMTRAASGILIVAGPHTGGGPYALYTWTPPGAPTRLTDITAPPQTAPEAVVTYDSAVQIVFDGGDVVTGGVQCKDQAVAARSFFTLE
jgi:hypothetical protein